jgi:GxxExxY protein
MTEEEKDPQTHAIIGAAMEVHQQLGPGFLEAVYQEAFALELEASGIPFQREVELPVFYKGEKLGCCYRADFVCFGCIVVELKAIPTLSGIEKAQVLNYLRATALELGLLINFGRLSLEFQRLAYANSRKVSKESAE